MELSIKIEKDLSNNKRFFVKDTTAWGTVPEGSNDPPINRNQRRLVLLIDRYTRGEYIPVPLENITPNGFAGTVSEWQVDVELDGYYKMILVAALPHDINANYTLGKIVYGLDTQKLYEAMDTYVPVGTSLEDTVFWEPIKSVANYPVMNNTGAEILCKHHIHDLASRVCIAEKALKFAGDDCGCPDEELRKDYRDSLLYHHAAIYSGAFGEMEESGKFLDQVIDRCGSGSDNDNGCGCG